MAGVLVCPSPSVCITDKEPLAMPDPCENMSVLLCLGLTNVVCERLCPQEGLSLHSQLPGSVEGF